MEREFKSPRRVEEELRQSNRERFERYMTMADEGIMEREVAIDALHDLFANAGGDNGTQATD